MENRLQQAALKTAVGISVAHKYLKRLDKYNGKHNVYHTPKSKARKLAKLQRKARRVNYAS